MATIPQWIFTHSNLPFNRELTNGLTTSFVLVNPMVAFILYSNELQHHLLRYPSQLSPTLRL